MAISQSDIMSLQESFEQLDRPQKEQKILIMIQYLADDNNIFVKLKRYLEDNAGALSDEELSDIYNALIQALYSFALDEIGRQFAHLEKISKMLDDAYQKEQKQKEQELREADNLLQNI